MTRKAPGKYRRTGISLMQLAEMFPDEEAATKWFEFIYWESGRRCGHCQSKNTKEVPNAKPMPYWCTDCRSYFSVRTGTVLQCTRVPLRKWAFAIYLYVTNLKGISSMKLHREIHVTQRTAWYMLHRIRTSWEQTGLCDTLGPMEADETYVGGLEGNKHASKKLHAGRGAVGKTPVAGVKSRQTNRVVAKVVEDTTSESLLDDFLFDHIRKGSTIYTDEAKAYKRLDTYDLIHEAVSHSDGEYVREEDIHTNGIESFWSVLKRAHQGTFHRMSKKHLQRYVTEFVTKHNMREFDTDEQMASIVAGLAGHRLMYESLVL
ncbi:MAG: IS1595 family transposase [Gammaproteobacteria bacterium]|nr:IS1595 family transposase [Gammaproteobacteria bacterium]